MKCHPKIFRNRLEIVGGLEEGKKERNRKRDRKRTKTKKKRERDMVKQGVERKRRNRPNVFENERPRTEGRSIGSRGGYEEPILVTTYDLCRRLGRSGDDFYLYFYFHLSLYFYPKSERS